MANNSTRRSIEFLVQGALPPHDTNVLWMDTSTPELPVLKIFENGAWASCHTDSSKADELILKILEEQARTIDNQASTINTLSDNIDKKVTEFPDILFDETTFSSALIGDTLFAPTDGIKIIKGSFRFPRGNRTRYCVSIGKLVFDESAHIQYLLLVVGSKAYAITPYPIQEDNYIYAYDFKNPEKFPGGHLSVPLGTVIDWRNFTFASEENATANKEEIKQNTRDIAGECVIYDHTDECLPFDESGFCAILGDNDFLVGDFLPSSDYADTYKVGDIIHVTGDSYLQEDYEGYEAGEALAVAETVNTSIIERQSDGTMVGVTSYIIWEKDHYYRITAKIPFYDGIDHSMHNLFTYEEVVTSKTITDLGKQIFNEVKSSNSDLKALREAYDTLIEIMQERAAVNIV